VLSAEDVLIPNFPKHIRDTHPRTQVLNVGGLQGGYNITRESLKRESLPRIQSTIAVFLNSRGIGDITNFQTVPTRFSYCSHSANYFDRRTLANIRDAYFRPDWVFRRKVKMLSAAPIQAR
jgi:hypothetical protein